MLYVTVTITGAAVMILELLGTRIIGPFYGVSLYVWSSLIAVTLIALALGYLLRGIDRRSISISPSGSHHSVFCLHDRDHSLSGWADPPRDRFTRAACGRLRERALALHAAVDGAGDGRPLRDQARHARLERSGHSQPDLSMRSARSAAWQEPLLLGFFLLPMFGTRAIIFSLSLLLATLAVFVAWHEAQKSLAHSIRLAYHRSSASVIGYRRRIRSCRRSQSDPGIHRPIRSRKPLRLGARRGR